MSFFTPSLRLCWKVKNGRLCVCESLADCFHKRGTRDFTSVPCMHAITAVIKRITFFLCMHPFQSFQVLILSYCHLTLRNLFENYDLNTFIFEHLTHSFGIAFRVSLSLNLIYGIRIGDNDSSVNIRINGLP